MCIRWCGAALITACVADHNTSGGSDDHTTGFDVDGSVRARTGHGAFWTSATDIPNPAPMKTDIPNPVPADWADPLFAQPFIDTDEWRDTPVRHRYVHGGFKGTDALFAMYFPPKEQYEGRFFQPVAATSGSELSSQRFAGPGGNIGFAIASGGYLVESNLGSGNMYPLPIPGSRDTGPAPPSRSTAASSP